MDKNKKNKVKKVFSLIVNTRNANCFTGQQGYKSLENIAKISANNDGEVGNLISEAISKVGREGVVTVEESQTGDTRLEIVEGMQFESKYLSRTS